MRQIKKTPMMHVMSALAGITLGLTSSFYQDNQRQQDANQRALRQYQQLPAEPFQRIGFTFSVPYAEWLGPLGTWEETLEAGLRYLKPDLVRVTNEWDDAEPTRGQVNLERTEKTIALCHQYGANVILCLGVKSPRYPEVHVPEIYRSLVLESKPDLARHELNLTNQDVRDSLLNCIRVFVTRYANDPRVEAFQVENEPLECVGDPARSVPFQFLREEVELIRSLTKKPLIVTMGAGMTESIEKMLRVRPQLLDQLLSLPVDRVGFNIYDKGFGHRWSFEATGQHWQATRGLFDRVRAAGKEPFIAELQAEPWQANPAEMDFDDPSGNSSLTPESYAELFNLAERLGCSDVLLWGIEFQLACKAKDNHRWLDKTSQLVSQ